MVEGGGTPVKRIPEGLVYFNVCRQSSCFNFPPSNQSSFYILILFVDSRGRGARGRDWFETLVSNYQCILFAHNI